MNEYPKILYGSGWEDLSRHIIVVDEEDEKLARGVGFDDLPELEESPVKPAVDAELTRSELKQLYFELSGKQASSKIGTAKLKQAILNLEG